MLKISVIQNSERNECIIFVFETEQVFAFWMFSAKQGYYWYHFYNLFGMTRSLTGDWTRDLPHSMPALYH